MRGFETNLGLQMYEREFVRLFVAVGTEKREERGERREERMRGREENGRNVERQRDYQASLITRSPIISGNFYLLGRALMNIMTYSSLSRSS